MKKIKSLILTLFLSFLALSLTACNFNYTGTHKDLYTVAVYNLFGALGHITNGKAVYNPNIDIIETANYGRTLYYYEESGFFGRAIVIMQKSEDNYVYYYQDDCYTPYCYADSLMYPKHLDYSDIFSEEDFVKLKERNDWNKEIYIEKCTKTQIIDNRKPKGTLDIKDKEFEKAIKAYVITLGYKGDDNIFRVARYCNTDKYGRELYYVYGIGRDVDGEGVSPSSKSQDFKFAMIFNPDKTCPIDNIYDISDTSINYYEVVMSLKHSVGWNQLYKSSIDN